MPRILSIILILLFASPLAGQDLFFDTVDVNVVNVEVIVTDKDGNPATGLTRDDFEVFEDGKQVCLETDTDLDGKPDRKLRLRDGNPAELEEDRNHDGRIDYRADYTEDGQLAHDWTDEDGKHHKGVLNGVSVTPLTTIHMSREFTYFEKMYAIKQIR